MNCPVCKDVTLVIADRQGIEVDYCPQCRGVWLDRGELDKIIERSATAGFGPAPSQSQRREQSYRKDYDDDYDYKKRKKKNFLNDLFDF